MSTRSTSVSLSPWLPDTPAASTFPESASVRLELLRRTDNPLPVAPDALSRSCVTLRPLRDGFIPSPARKKSKPPAVHAGALWPLTPSHRGTAAAQLGLAF